MASDEVAAEVADFLDLNPEAIESLIEADKLLDSPDVSSCVTLNSLLQEPEFHRGLRTVREIGELAQVSADARRRVEFSRPPQTGDVVHCYRLGDCLARRGGGLVFRAVHLETGVKAVLKFLSSQGPEDTSSKRLRRELDNLQQHNHPGAVCILDCGELPGFVFLAMEELQGFDLSQIVELLGPLSVANSCAVIQQAAEALAFLHAQGLIHRDLKPSNLFLTEDGRVKVIDFGLARFVGDEESLTGSGQLLGTIDYMAPEQAFDTREANASSDIYSLGCTLFKLLTGEVPFGAPLYRHFLRKAIAHAASPFPSLRSRDEELPSELDALIQRCCAKNPQERFSSVAELAEGLAEFSDHADLRTLVKTATELAYSKCSIPTAGSAADSIRMSIPQAESATPGRVIPVWLTGLGAAALLGLGGFWIGGLSRAVDRVESQASFRNNPEVSTLSSFNVSGNFELDAEPWARIGQVDGKVTFRRTDSRFFRGQSALEAVPIQASAGPGPNLSRRVEGLEPGKPYILSAGFDTSTMTAGKLGVDVAGPGLYHRLTPAPGCDGWMYYWLEFVPTRTFVDVRLVYDSEMRLGDSGCFDAIAITPKTEFVPLIDDAALAMRSRQIMGTDWLYEPPLEQVSQFEFSRSGLLFVGDSKGNGLTLELSPSSGTANKPIEVGVRQSTVRSLKFIGATSEVLQLNGAGELERRDLRTPEKRTQLSEIGGIRELLAISPDGQSIAVRSDRDQIQIWNLNQIKMVFELSLPQSTDCKVELAGNGGMVAIHQGNWLGLFSPGKEAPVNELRLSSGQIRGARLSPDSSSLLVADSEKKVRVYQLPDLIETANFRTNFALSGFLEPSVDQQYLLLGSEKQVLWLYDLKAQRPIWWTDGVAGYFSSGNEVVTAFPNVGLAKWSLNFSGELPGFFRGEPSPAAPTGNPR